MKSLNSTIKSLNKSVNSTVSTVKKMNKNKMLDYTVIVFMLVYIFTNVETPKMIAECIDNKVSHILLYGLAISCLFYNPVLAGVLFVFVFQLISRSEKQTGTFQKREYLPSEYTKNKELNAFNQFPETLEEEIINNMVPLPEDDLGRQSYKSVQNNLHDAAQL